MLLLLECGIIIGLYILRRVKSKDTKSRVENAVGWILLATYFVYPYGCKSIFGIFNCQEIDSVRYLRADLRIDCDSGPHKAAEAFAGIMIVLFPVGLPLLYFAMLFINRKELYEDNKTDVTKKMQYLRFFFGEYEAQYYFWEAIECFRKCVMMGFASFYQPGSLLQLILVMILTVFYALILSIYKPCECMMYMPIYSFLLTFFVQISMMRMIICRCATKACFSLLSWER